MTQTFNEDVVFNNTALFKDEVTFQDSAKATFKKEAIFEDALKIKQDIICDVRAWGAKGDGNTDDTSAIQDAINSLDSQGGIVFLPPGTYLISSALEIKRTDTPTSVDHSYVSFIGSGRGATVIKMDSNFSSYALKIYGKNSSMSLVKAVVKDFSIDGNNQSNAEGGIMLENARFWTLENIEITKIDNSNAIGIYIKDSFNISCKHCRVAMGTSAACKGDAGYQVYSTAGTNNATDIIFLNSISQYNDIGFEVTTNGSIPSTNIAFINASAGRNETANYKIGERVKNVIFENINVESKLEENGHGLTDYGIYLLGTTTNPIHNVTIRSCFINQCSIGVYARYVKGLKITNNRFRGTRQEDPDPENDYFYGTVVDIQNCEQVLYDDLNTWKHDAAADFYQTFLASNSGDPRITRVRMYNNSDPAQNIPTGLGTWTTVELNLSNFNIGGTADTTNDRVKDLQPGYYAIFGCITYTGSTDQRRHKAGIYVNTSQKAQAEVQTSGSQEVCLMVRDIVKITNMTDYIQLKAAHNSGAGINVKSGTSRTWLTVERINLLEE